MSEAGATPSVDTGATSGAETGTEVSTETTSAAEKGASKAPESKSQDDFEEIKLGGVGGRVPKQLAQAIKALERGFHSKAQESASLKKEMTARESLAKQNPKEFVKKFGLDPVEFAESTLAEQLEMMAMSPEQRELRDLKAWKEQQEKLANEAKEREEQERVSKQEAELSKTLRGEILSAWKESGLPAHPYFGQVIARHMLAASSQGKELPAAKAAAIVRREFTGHVREILSQLTPEALQEMLGDEPLKKWREFDVKRVIPQGSQKSSAKGPEKSVSQKQKPMTEAEFRNWNPLAD
jgi:hypothetical protein